MGCSLSEDTDLLFPNFRDIYIVESYLTPGEPLKLALIKNNSFDKEGVLAPLWFADVFVSTSAKSFKLLNNLHVGSENKYIFNYVNSKVINRDYIGEYKLVIVTDEGDTITSVTKTVSQVEILDYNVQDEMVEITHTNGRDSGYYMLSTEKFQGNKLISSNSVFFDYSNIHLPKIKSVIINDYISYSLLVIKVFHITKENYEFQKSSQAAYVANIDPFSVPTRIDSNINGGVGVFTYYTSDEIRLTK